MEIITITKVWNFNPKKSSRIPRSTDEYFRHKERVLNDRLRNRGHLFLNELYDMFDIPRTQFGGKAGWLAKTGPVVEIEPYYRPDYIDYVLRMDLIPNIIDTLNEDDCQMTGVVGEPDILEDFDVDRNKSVIFMEKPPYSDFDILHNSSMHLLKKPPYSD